MAKKPPVHTVPTKTGWANKQGSEVNSSHKTKAAATKEGKSQAKADKTEHVIHKSDGKIGDKNSYGPDPMPPRDKK